MRNLTTLTATIARMRRTTNTVNGGPRYAIDTANGVRFHTAPDTADSFGWVAVRLTGQRVTLTLDSRDRVVGIAESTDTATVTL